MNISQDQIGKLRERISRFQFLCAELSKAMQEYEEGYEGKEEGERD